MAHLEMNPFSVNWTDGMKVSKKDFLDLEHSINERIRWAVSLFIHEGRYGLLPISSNSIGTDYPGFKIDGDRITLKECRAITRGGYPIEITSENAEEKKIPLQFPTKSIPIDEKGDFDIFIQVSPGKLEDAGDLMPNGRYKYSIPKYDLSIVKKKIPSTEYNSSSPTKLKIGELSIKEGTPILNKKFVPACVSMNGHSKLKETHEAFGKILFDDEEGSLQSKIMKCYSQTFQSSEQVSDLAENLTLLSEKLMLFLTQRYHYYNRVLQYDDPVNFFAFFFDLARYLSSIELLLRPRFSKNASLLIKKNYPVECIKDNQKDREESGDPQTVFGIAENLGKSIYKENFGYVGYNEVIQEIKKFLDALDCYFGEMQSYNFGKRKRFGGKSKKKGGFFD